MQLNHGILVPKTDGFNKKKLVKEMKEIFLPIYEFYDKLNKMMENISLIWGTRNESIDCLSKYCD